PCGANAIDPTIASTRETMTKLEAYIEELLVQEDVDDVAIIIRFSSPFHLSPFASFTDGV
ncbi:hypothetical protein BKA70DRAFT_1128955, partial [Coprinopsis sp. MPI-PUGE-AT-0042]